MPTSTGRVRLAVLLSAAVFIFTAAIRGQAPQTPPAGGRGAQPPTAGRGLGRPEAYPQRAPEDPAMVERGRTLYGVNCAFCHGSDARGGETGPNLLRSQLVLNDQHGELIIPVVQNGRPERGMPKLDLTAAQIRDIAAFVHSFRVGGYDVSRMVPPSVVVGNANAGQGVFTSLCASCHSVTGDLKGLGARITDAKLLQQTWLMPGSGRGGGGPMTQPLSLNVPPTTVTVTLPSGEKVEGRLGRIDDFIVTLTQADGTPRSFRRDGDTPKVEVHDPLQPHRDLLSKYTDEQIRDLTAYLVTVK
jgi:cytochrome c oxidase cbb3-type subunit III